MSLINTWQFSLLMYYVFNVIFFQFYKLSVKDVNKDGAATVIFQVTAGLSVLLLVPFFAWRLPNTLSILLLLVAASLFYAVNDRLQMTVRKNLDVSIFSILGQFGAVFLIIYGFIIFKDELILTKIIGALLIIAANVSILYKPGKSRPAVYKYYAIGIIALLACATAITIGIGISERFNLAFYVSLTLLIPAAMVALSGKIRLSSIADELNRGSKKLYAITGFSGGLSILFGLRAYQLGEVSTIVPLQAVTVILNVLVAYVFLKECEDGYKKLLAAVIAVSGVYLTVL